ncbi:DNA primase [Patescibacteria group bacterium]|nr:DNA primase [Patescibacteria group bacterium]MBU1673292.1 DNA primase [Patescibacteria group bacterium]MBU1963202.1 DNA primase [Patescibacteria group bacterium]
MLNSPVEEIKQRLDIVDIVSEYLTLKKAGGNYRALCPFHNEKTPSFNVSQEKQIYHCFGCDKGGDMFQFVQEMEGMEFPEALRVLAKKANVTLEKRNPELENKRTRILDIIREACEYYEDALKESQIGLKYIEERKIKAETSEEFKLGYSYDDWEKLYKYLLDKKYAQDEIFQAGLVVKSEKSASYYDRFRGRLMFPIQDVHGNVVGFTARKLIEKEEDKTGKYINSPQTMVYDKSRVIYGLDKAKTNIKKLGATIIVEGNMDVIACHQAGFKNVVASSGTALTEFQVELLKRYSPNLIIAFDMDTAGAEAAKRGIDVALQKEMNVKVLTLPGEAKDPDDVIKENPALFKEAIKNAKNIMDYYFDTALKGRDLNSVDDKKKIAKEILPAISKIGDSIERTHYIQKLSELINVPENLLMTKVGPRARAAISTKESPKASGRVETNRYEKLSERIVALALFKPIDFKYFNDYLDSEYLVGEEIEELYKKMVSYYNNEGQFKVDEFASKNPELGKRVEILAILGEGEFSDLSEKDLQKEVVSSIKDLEKYYVKKRINQIQAQIGKSEGEGNDEDIDELAREFSLLTQKLNNIS